VASILQGEEEEAAHLAAVVVLVAWAGTGLVASVGVAGVAKVASCSSSEEVAEQGAVVVESSLAVEVAGVANPGYSE